MALSLMLLIFMLAGHYNEVVKKGPNLLEDIFNRIWAKNSSKIIRKLSENSKRADINQ